jgi:exopolyphosphatase/guanosine-5'-triphosphate,3'-diphosphate pyrophosphatase
VIAVAARVATIDLGTNTVRLLVADVEPDGCWRGVADDQRITRLGEGQATGGPLGAAPMQRAAATVAEFAARARALGADPVRIVGTSAVREAPNRAELLRLIREATGLPVEVVSGPEEGRLALLGVRTGLPGLAEPFVLLDIGGGSTELVLARPGAPPLAVSLRLGGVALAERHLDAGAVDAARFAALRAAVDGALTAVPAEMAAGAASLVGTAGTITTLAALDLGLPAYDAAAVHGHRLTRAAVDALRARLCALTVDERAALPCLPRGRADVIIPGIAIALAVMDRLLAPAMLVSDHGLREGLLCELARA